MLSTELSITSAFQYYIACYVFSTCACYVMDQKFIPSTFVWLQNTIMHEISETLFFLRIIGYTAIKAYTKAKSPWNYLKAKQNIL